MGKQNVVMKNGLIFLTLSLICTQIYAQGYCIPYRFVDNYYFRSRDIQLTKDIVYGQAEDHNGKIKILDLDIYSPKQLVDSLKKRPLLMLIHGGSTGDKAKMERYCPLFAQRGLVVSTINRRKGTEKNPDALSIFKEAYRAAQDAHAALRFLIKNADEYGIDTAAVFVGGASGGALISLGISFMYQQDFDTHYPMITESLGRMDNSTNQIITKFNVKGIVAMWGQIPDTTFISLEEAQNIPIIMFHGTADSSPSPYEKSLQIANRFKNLGGCYQLHTKTGAGHGANMSKYYIANKTGCFIKSILCDSCTSLRREIDNGDQTCDFVMAIDKATKERSSINIDYSLVGQYAGLYKSEKNKKDSLSVFFENGHLILEANNGSFKYEIFPESQYDFFAKDYNLQVAFNKDENEMVSELIVFIDAKEIKFKRRISASPFQMLK